MSRQETHVGKIKPTGLSLVEWMFENQHLVPDPYKCNDPFDMFYSGLSCGYNKFILLDGEVWEVIQDKEYDDYEILEMTSNFDGTFNYVLSYYNGGCGFSEAMQYAKDKLNDI